MIHTLKLSLTNLALLFTVGYFLPTAITLSTSSIPFDTEMVLVNITVLLIGLIADLSYQVIVKHHNGHSHQIYSLDTTLVLLIGLIISINWLLL